VPKKWLKQQAQKQLGLQGTPATGG
jgi:hypothetical protein